MTFKPCQLELDQPPNDARAANPAMTALFHAGRQWRGVADARR
jgi:hypothetical protein